jgi:hypothetical protein
VKLTTIMDTFASPPRIFFHAPYPRTIKAFSFAICFGIPCAKITLDNETDFYVRTDNGYILNEVSAELKQDLVRVFGSDK